MPEYTYLDKTGLTTFKSKIDVTYAKKNDVYTKAQVDSAIAGVGLPTITIAQSQVISQSSSSIDIQLTDEQYTIINKGSVVLDMSALGMSVVVANYTDTDGDYLFFVVITPNGSNDRIFYDKVAVDIAENTKKLYYWKRGFYPEYAQIAMSADYADEANSVDYSTTAPTSANTDGNLKVIVLSSEPATRYDGYLYIITGSNS